MADRPYCRLLPLLRLPTLIIVGHTPQGRGPRETGRTVRQVHHVVGRLDAPEDVQLQRFGAVRVRGVRLLVAAAAGRRPVAAQHRDGRRRRRRRPRLGRILVVAAAAAAAVVVTPPAPRRGRRARSRGT